MGVVVTVSVTGTNLNLMAMLVGLLLPASTGIYFDVVGEVVKFPIEVHVVSPFF